MEIGVMLRLCLLNATKLFKVLILNKIKSIIKFANLNNILHNIVKHSTWTGCPPKF